MMGGRSFEVELRDRMHAWAMGYLWRSPGVPRWEGYALAATGEDVSDLVRLLMLAYADGQRDTLDVAVEEVRKVIVDSLPKGSLAKP